MPEKIKPYLNFKTYSIDFSQPDVKITDIDFRLCRTDFDPCSGFPEMFLKLLRDVLSENIALIKNFQRIHCQGKDFMTVYICTAIYPRSIS